MIGRSVHPNVVGSPIAWGTVGWDSDSGNSFFDLGDASGSDSETATTLIRVTLNRGKDASKALNQSVAQGHRILCQVIGSTYFVPPLGTRVIVAIPEPHGMIGAQGTIIAAFDSRGSLVFGSSYQPGDVLLAAFTSYATMLLKGDGSARIGARQGDQSGGQPVEVVAAQDGSVSVNAETVNLGNNPTDGVVLDSLNRTLLNALTAWVNAVAGALSSAGFPIALPTTTFLTAVGQPMASTTVKAQT